MPLPDVPDTYRLVLVQTYNAQEVLNVFHYRDTTLAGLNPLNMATQFWAQVKTAWRAWLPASSAALFQRVEVEALFDDHEFGIYTVPTAEQQGTRSQATDFMPMFVSGVIGLNVGSRVTRPGSKRIFGVLEGDTSGIQVLTTAAHTLLQALADVLDQPLDVNGVDTAKPVIVGYPGIRNPSGVRVSDVVDAVASTFIGHQVSRDSRHP